LREAAIPPSDVIPCACSSEMIVRPTIHDDLKKQKIGVREQAEEGGAAYISALIEAAGLPSPRPLQPNPTALGIVR
jgi:hypothetical protein